MRRCRCPPWQGLLVSNPKRVEAIADSLRELSPPLVERVDFQGGAYRITGQGVLFVQNASQEYQGFQGLS